jgi:hypothetical protein
VCAGDAIRPRGELVRTVAGHLDRRAQGAAGYFVIDGMSDQLVDQAAADTFQAQLMYDVWAELGARGWGECSMQTRLNMFLADDGRLPEGLVGRTATFKTLHLDPHSIIFAHRYEPPENVLGGDVLLVDARSYLRDNELASTDVFYVLHGKHDEGRMVAHEEHRASMLAAYCTRVPVPTSGYRLVIVRNHLDYGVAHEITEIKPAVPGKAWRRSFLRTSIAPLH